MHKIEDRYYHFVCFVILSLFILGTNRCQEDYDFASDAGSATPNPASPSATPTASVSPSPIDDEEGEEGEEEEESESPSPSVSPSPATENAFFFSRNFLRAVAKQADSDNAEQDKAPADDELIEISRVQDLAVSARSEQANWLGSTYANDDQALDRDSDNDGYTDRLEQDSGTSPQDPLDIPPPPVTELRQRLLAGDRDFDGLSDAEEEIHGTDSTTADTDNDSINDSAEVLSGSDPMNATSIPLDFDGDSLSDEYEISIGTDPKSPDSDNDKLSDGYEVRIKSDPLSSDTDKDGILDWREVILGSDPIIPEKVG